MEQQFLPKSFLKSLSKCSGFDEARFLSSHQEQATISIRYNPNKKSNLINHTDKVPWCGSGYYLKSRPEFIFDPSFHAGTYYVQEASSMFLDFALRNLEDLNEDKAVLDLCAAPGGKSTILSDFLNHKGLLVSNEVISSRCKILEENLVKWNSLNSIITNNDPSSFGKLNQIFDLVLVDAPCSGSGLFRKDPLAIKEWSTNAISHCSARQKRILADIIPSIKHNGYLIYCTCSFSKEENEDILDWALDNFNLESKKLKIPTEWGIIETKSDKNSAYGYRFYPYNLNGEGFFISILKNRNTGLIQKTKSKKNNIFTFNSQLEPWIKRNEEIILESNNETIIALPKRALELIHFIQSNLNIINRGVTLGKIIRGELIPDHQLSMSNLFSEDVTKIDLDLVDSIKYLRKENIILQTDKRGWVLVCYQGVALGWIKVMENRTNNNYPKEWRILKEYKK